MHSIYLDFNSTAPLLPEAAEAMAAAQAADYANPASQHTAGRKAHRVLEDAREEISRSLGAELVDRQPDKLIFTSGGTEANNLALLGLTGARMDSLPFSRDPKGSVEIEGRRQQAEDRTTGRIVVSSIEHPSVMAAADYLAQRGWQVDRLRVIGDGVVCLQHLDELLAAKSSWGLPRLVSVMLANNETGVIQPIAQIVDRCQALNVPVHTDAVQAAGKMPIDFRALGVAAMTMAPHKFGGPRGIGGLLLRHGIALNPLLHGATQQGGLRPGTESVVLPVGFLAALRAWVREREKLTARMRKLRDSFESAVLRTMPCAVINGGNSPRLPHTSNVAFLGHDRQALFMALDLAGVCCSTGSACASGSSEPSPTLLAMNLPREIIDSSLRFSLGPTTTTDEIDEAVRRIQAVLAAAC